MNHRSWAQGPALTGITLAALLLLEFGLRLVVEPDADLESFVRVSREFAQPCVARVWRDGEERIVDRSPAGSFDLPLVPDTSAVRVAIVGESTGAFLGDALSFIAADTPTQILNCAMPGSALEHMQARTTEVLAYHPDVVIVVFGHNLGFQYPAADWRLRLVELGLGSRLFSLFVPQREPVAADAMDGQRLEAYRTWLLEAARLARASDTKLIVVTLPANHWIPTEDAVGCDQRTAVLAALVDWYGGRQDLAIDRLRAEVASAGDNCTKFLLATWLRRFGRTTEARPFLDALSDSPQWASDRSPAGLNPMLRQIADAEQLLVHDMEQRVAQRAADGIPGWRQMRDHCHVNEENLARESLALLPVVCRAAGKQCPEVHRSAADYFGESNLLQPLEGLILAQRDASPRRAHKWLLAIPHVVEEWAVSPEGAEIEDLRRFVQARLPQLEPRAVRRARIHVRLAEGLWHSDRRDEALVVNSQARQVDLAEAWLQLAFFRLADDPAAAEVAAARARAIDPASAAAAFLLRTLGQVATSDVGR